jgi:hypothetical protein
MEVSGEHHAPAALTPGKNIDTCWTGGWLGLRAVLGVVGDEILDDRDSYPGPTRP